MVVCLRSLAVVLMKDIVSPGTSVWRRIVLIVPLVTLMLLPLKSAGANEQTTSAPTLKIGFSVPLSGEEAQTGGQILIALQLWRDDVNARGGLLHRPVELIYSDDQGNPGKVPGIYRKLIAEEKVDLILGPSTTSLSAAAMRVVMEYGKVEISILGIGANRIFAYPRFFAMLPFGPDGAKTLSEDFFTLSAEQRPKPQTVALLTAGAEFPQAIAAGARDNAAAGGFKIVFDKSYLSGAAGLDVTFRDLKAANPDIVLVSSGAREMPNIIRSANQQGVAPKMFGAMNPASVGAKASEAYDQSLDGIISAETFVRAQSLDFLGLADVLRRYRAEAAGKQIDVPGLPVVPFAYAAGQILAQAVKDTESIESDRLADYIHSHTFDTVVGSIEYGKYGEWKDSRLLLTQFQRAGVRDVDRLAPVSVRQVVWPQLYKTGDLVYPYATAK